MFCTHWALEFCSRRFPEFFKFDWFLAIWQSALLRFLKIFSNMAAPMSSFIQAKKTRLKTQDLSKKGSIDEEILELVNYINDTEHYCTTSSCSGRIIVVSEVNYWRLLRCVRTAQLHMLHCRSSQCTLWTLPSPSPTCVAKYSASLWPHNSPPCWAVNGSAWNIGFSNCDSDETDVKSGAIIKLIMIINSSTRWASHTGAKWGYMLNLWWIINMTKLLNRSCLSDLKCQ